MANGNKCRSLSVGVPLIYLGYFSFSGGRLEVMPLGFHFLYRNLMIRKVLYYYYYFFNYKTPGILSDRCHPGKMVVDENLVIQAHGLQKVNFLVLHILILQICLTI